MIPDIQTGNNEWQTVQVDRIETNNVIIVTIVVNVFNLDVVSLSVVVDPEVRFDQSLVGFTSYNIKEQAHDRIQTVEAN